MYLARGPEVKCVRISVSNDTKGGKDIVRERNCLFFLEAIGCSYFPENQNFLMKTNALSLPCLSVLGSSCLRHGQPLSWAPQSSLPILDGNVDMVTETVSWAVGAQGCVPVSPPHTQYYLSHSGVNWPFLLSTEPLYALLSSLQGGGPQHRINSDLGQLRTETPEPSRRL